MTPLFATAYFPPIGYMAALTRHPAAAIEAKETFPKQTYRNRMEIMTAGGMRVLTVPVLRGNHSRTEEVRIDYSSRWQTIHLRTLAAAYGASPYWLYYKDGIEALLGQQYGRLIDLNQATTVWTLKMLKVQCRLSYTEDYRRPGTPADGTDYREAFSPKKADPTQGYTPYYQVFNDRIPFTPGLSILDLLMNMGPEAADYLKSLS